LVNSVQGKSEAIRFTAAHTRTRASAEAFCAENDIALQDDLDQILCDPAIDGLSLRRRIASTGRRSREPRPLASMS
jgi:hypothetical protein